MKTGKPNTRILLVLSIFLIFAGKNVFSQDSPVLYTWDPSSFSESILISSSSMSMEYSISHYPEKEDSLTYQKFKKLIHTEPTEKNYSDYYALALALWELERLDEAEKMFLTIVNSTKRFYTGTYYNSSDIPGDTTTNLYGYGSYTWHYKHYACQNLTKIYIEKKKFALALKYLEDADKKYKVVHTCGTGYMMHRDGMDRLYGLCYDGLKMYKTIVKKFLPDYSDMYNGTLVKAIKKLYTRQQIATYLAIAVKSIAITDTFQGYSYTYEDYGTENEKKIESRYITGSAMMNLFGVKVKMEAPSLKNGEVVTREMFRKEFKQSGFYKALTEG